MIYKLVDRLMRFNIGLVLRRRLLLMVWNSLLWVGRRHATSVLILWKRTMTYPRRRNLTVALINMHPFADHSSGMTLQSIDRGQCCLTLGVLMGSEFSHWSTTVWFLNCSQVSNVKSLILLTLTFQNAITIMLRRLTLNLIIEKKIFNNLQHIKRFISKRWLKTL